jgi:hypothetical protein
VDEPEPADRQSEVEYEESRTFRDGLVLGAVVLSLIAGGVAGAAIWENAIEGPEPAGKTKIVTVPRKIVVEGRNGTKEAFESNNGKVLVEGNGIKKVFKSPNGTVIIKTFGDNESREREAAEEPTRTGRAVFISPGDGYTQAIQDLYPEHSGSA